MRINQKSSSYKSNPNSNPVLLLLDLPSILLITQKPPLRFFAHFLYSFSTLSPSQNLFPSFLLSADLEHSSHLCRSFGPISNLTPYHFFHPHFQRDSLHSGPNFSSSMSVTPFFNKKSYRCPYLNPNFHLFFFLKNPPM